MERLEATESSLLEARADKSSLSEERDSLLAQVLKFCKCSQAEKLLNN